ncbi:MAG: acetylxylan esterase [Fermentimonas sp.]|jgi:hypothetical protein
MKQIDRISFMITVALIMMPLSLAAQNYDESKVGSYTLPPLLTNSQGNKIGTVEEWEQCRRPEIVKLFEDNIYGQLPNDYDSINFRTLWSGVSFDKKSRFKDVAIDVSRNNRTLTFHAFLIMPNITDKKFPVFLMINHRRGRFNVILQEGYGNEDTLWPLDEIIDAGYAIAGFDTKSVSPDSRHYFADEVIKQLYPEQLNVPNGMRMLGAWGWGASRVIDYLESEPDIDAGKVMVMGFSRSGKAALWCAAQDERVAIAFSNESGHAGAKISRRNFGEMVESITRAAPHWFVPKYREYADNEEKLPVDQHMLLALIAPRGVYVGSAAEDLWADPKGQWLALHEAQPVFRLYGFNCTLPQDMPEVDKQLISLPLGFHNRAGEHDFTRVDWEHYIRFADKFYGKDD